MDDKTCATCAAWRRAGDDIGVCRRKSPTAALVVVEDADGKTGLQAFTAWPETSDEDGCWEHVPKEE